MPPIDLCFVGLAGGDVTVGLRDDDLATIDAIAPGWSSYFDDVPRAHKASIAPFWVTRAPISNSDLRRAGFDELARDREDTLVARVAYEDAKRVARALGGRLPTDMEWEYLCRAENPNPFPFDTSKRDESAAIEPWMQWHVSANQTANAFGLRVLYTVLERSPRECPEETCYCQSSRCRCETSNSKRSSVAWANYQQVHPSISPVSER